MPDPGIPNSVAMSLRNTLANCGAFDSNSKIRAVFSNALLMPWRNNLPEAETIAERVDQTIDYLQKRRNAETRINALVILLGVLRDRTDRGDTYYAQLTELTGILHAALDHESTERSLHEEANPTSQQMIFPAEWVKLLECIKSVGKVSVPKIIQGQTASHIPTGTGWLIAPNLALTCWHVIHARTIYDRPVSETDLAAQVTNSLITFDYTVPGQGISYVVTAIESFHSNLDYALIRLQDRADYPLSKYGYLKLDLDIPLTVQTQLYVIQHPKGEPQQLSTGRFIKYNQAETPHMLHSAPTEPGTSGAPILNVTNWHVAALHIGEDVATQLRSAILLRTILQHIQQERYDLYQQIIALQ